MFTADVENLVDNIINSDGNPCEKRKLILTTLSQLKNLKTEVNLYYYRCYLMPLNRRWWVSTDVTGQLSCLTF